MAKIDLMNARTGRMMKEDSTNINVADIIATGAQGVKAKPFSVSVQLVRPANTTAYAVGTTNLINSGPVVACATTDTSVTVTPASMAGIYVGQAVTGTGIPANTKVATVGATTVTLDKAATATAAAENLTFTSTAVLPCLDFSIAPYYGIAGQFVEIRSAILTSSYGAAATKLAAQIALYKSTAMQANQADRQTFSPTYTDVITNKACRLDDISVSLGLSTNCYEIMQADVSRLAELGVGGKLYAAILANNAYTPASGEIITLTIKGILH